MCNFFTGAILIINYEQDINEASSQNVLQLETIPTTLQMMEH